MELNEMIKWTNTAAKSGAEKALAQLPAASVHITKSEAYRLYGRSSVDRWLQEGLLTCPKKIDRAKLEAVAAASNRITYLPVAAR
jgi:hypothetical protein